MPKSSATYIQVRLKGNIWHKFNCDKYHDYTDGLIMT